MQIRLAQKNDIEALMRFIDEHWKKNHIMSTNQALMDFQHANNDGSYNYLIAENDGEIIGILGFIESKRYDANLAKENTTWLALWKVHKEKSPPLLGLKMLRELEKTSEHSAIAVNGINHTHPPMYQALGYEVIELAQYYMSNPNLAQNILQQKQPPIPSANGAATLQELNADDLNSLEIKLPKCTPQKTPTHFINRFLNHAFYDYNVHAIILDEQPQALIATRIATHENSKILRITDFAGNLDIIAECGPAFANLMQQQNAEYMDFFQYGIAHETITKCGFAKHNASSQTIVPNFFEPFTMINSRIISAIKTKNDSPILVCRADGDQDRPNQI